MSAARDPGLQPERTALAWQRTGVSAAVAGGVAVLAAAHRGGGPQLIGICLLAAITACCAGAAGTRKGAPGDAEGQRRDSPWWRLLATAGAVAVLALAGVLLATVPP